MAGGSELRAQPLTVNRYNLTQVGAEPRAALVASVGMTGPVILGRAGRTPLPQQLQDILCLAAEQDVIFRCDLQEQLQRAP